MQMRRISEEEEDDNNKEEEDCALGAAAATAVATAGLHASSDATDSDQAVAAVLAARRSGLRGSSSS